MVKEIVVVQAGWVLIGDVEEVDGGLHLANASIIRSWGTKSGLGEIALTGVTKTTILDYAGDVKVPVTSALLRIACKV